MFKIKKEQNYFKRKKKSVLDVHEYREIERNVMGQGHFKKHVKTSITLYKRLRSELRLIVYGF